MFDPSAWRAALRAFAVLAMLVSAPARAPAQAPTEDAYRATIDDAVQEFSAGRWAEARALFKRAHELSPNARTLRGMGMAAFEMRLYVQALRELDASLRDPRKPLDAELRAQVERLIVKAREFVGRVVPVVEPSAARLLIDGREPLREPDGALLLDVGTHVFSATLDGYKPTNVRVAVEGGSNQLVHVPLEPLLPVQRAVPAIDPTRQANAAPQSPPAAQPSAPPHPSPASPRDAVAPSGDGGDLDTFAWIALIGAAGFGATAAVLHFAVGDSQYRELEQGCGATARGCSDREISDSGIETTDALTNVFLGLAVVSGVTSGVLFAIDASSRDEHDPLALEVTPGAVRVTGRF